jgi:UDP-N-acetyl-2-amino-2-deoxyglucuronate dehydrogenase
MSLSAKIRIGIAGCGAAVPMYMVTVKYIADVEVAAIMDVDAAKLKSVGDRYGISGRYTNYEQMLREAGIDAVLIGTPTMLHREQAMLAAHHGKHVLLEKPMAPTIEACRDIIAACEQHGVFLMIGFMKRFDKAFLAATDFVKNGKLGKIHQVSTRWSWCAPRVAGKGYAPAPGEAVSHGGIYLEANHLSWREKLALTYGGVYQDHGSHVTDLCRWWLGEITSVAAEINIVREGCEVEDQACVIYRHVDGAISTHLQNRVTHTELTEYYLIDGADASLDMYVDRKWSYVSYDPFTMNLYRGGIERTDVTPPKHMNIDTEIEQHGRYRNELAYFAACVREGRQPAINTGLDGLRSIEAVNAAYLSSATGRKVTVPLSPEDERALRDIPALFGRIAAQSPH